MCQQINSKIQIFSFTLEVAAPSLFQFSSPKNHESNINFSFFFYYLLYRMPYGKIFIDARRAVNKSS
jgi:hypothetical protein